MFWDQITNSYQGQTGADGIGKRFRATFKEMGFSRENGVALFLSFNFM